MTRPGPCALAALLMLMAGSTATADDAVPHAAAPLPEAARPAPEGEGPLVQIAILLDNSGSMSGLIEQARGELWRVVNELSTSRRNGRRPRLQVALYTYGNPPPRQWSPLTDDLDRVSESLFAVTIGGGSEYCGQVIGEATRALAWSTRPNDLKMIFIAGNEPFSQGPVDYRQACREAIARGIIVNTIHCGNGIPDDWRDGALLADGRPMSINQNTQVVHIAAPQDTRIAELGVQLNATYVPYGAAGEAGRRRQVAQDANAAGLSMASAGQRAVAKANTHYRNTAWDLVDAVAEGVVSVEEVEEAELPDDMKRMSVAQRRHYLSEQQARRKALQDEINQLNAERTKFVDARRRASAQETGANTLDKALIDAIRAQAIARQFEFDG